MTARIISVDELLNTARVAAGVVLSDDEIAALEALGLTIQWRSDVALWRGK